MSESKDPLAVDAIVGARVRAARVAVGMSQTALAERVGLSFQQVQKYESGSNRISASKLVAMAQELGLAPADFLGGLEGANSQKGDFSFFNAPGAMELLRLYAALGGREQRGVLGLVRAISPGPSSDDPNDVSEETFFDSPDEDAKPT